MFGGGIGGGFAQLKAFDSNDDGIVNSEDTGFSELLLWQDKNSNHQTDAGELTSLKNAGVASLNTGYQALPELQNGNLLLERSVATWTDGRMMEMVDVYFRVDQRSVQPVQPATAGMSSSTIIVKSELNAKPITVMGLQGPLFVANGAVTTGKPAALAESGTSANGDVWRRAIFFPQGSKSITRLSIVEIDRLLSND